jgi:transposase-like protein
MLNPPLPPLRPELAVCPDPTCGASGRIGIHSHTKRRFKCHACGTTFADTVGTPLYRLKAPLWGVRIVLTRLAFGCPIPAIVAAFGLDERTVTAWQQKAGHHAKQVQETVVCQGQVDLGQVQGDELYVKPQRGTVWMATARGGAGRAADPVGGGWLCRLDHHNPASVPGSGSDRQVRAATTGGLARGAYCPSAQALYAAAADRDRAAAGAWVSALR